MMGFFTAHVNAQLAKLRADQARLHTENCVLRTENQTLRADNDWLLKMGRQHLAEQRKQRQLSQFMADENLALHSSLAAAVENNRKLGMALFKALGHPSVRSETAKTMGLN
jgi:hypothetical protein